MNYVPGKGGAAAVASTATAVTAVELPKTGATMLNEIAIASLAALVVWAIVYKLLTRKNA